MGARRFLLLGVGLLVLAWAASRPAVLRHAPDLIGYLVAALFVLAAVRIGLSIAIIAFDLSPVSIVIPVALGVLAWWLRPGRNARF